MTLITANLMGHRQEMSLELSKLLSLLRAGEAVPVADWPESGPSAAEAGLIVSDGLILPPEEDWLSLPTLQAQLPDGWAAEIVPAIGSTNTALMQRASQRSINGAVLLTEFQSSGRGRRGRAWYSPVARNLAMSLGFASPVPAFKLPGASLVVGLAVCRTLRALGGQEVSVKWPNDIYCAGKKLCGILVEVSADQGTQLVVGIGVNVSLPDAYLQQIDQPATDLRRIGVQANRSEVAVAIASGVIERVEAFFERGFEPFREEYDKLHALHGRDCVVRTGDQSIFGRVHGVLEDGRLNLETSDGLQAFAGGEASLRRSG